MDTAVLFADIFLKHERLDIVLKVGVAIADSYPQHRMSKSKSQVLKGGG